MATKSGGEKTLEHLEKGGAATRPRGLQKEAPEPFIGTLQTEVTKVRGEGANSPSKTSFVSWCPKGKKKGQNAGEHDRKTWHKERL